MGGGASARPGADADGEPQFGESGDRLRLAPSFTNRGALRFSSLRDRRWMASRDLSAETAALWMEMGIPADVVVRLPESAQQRRRRSPPTPVWSRSAAGPGSGWSPRRATCRGRSRCAARQGLEVDAAAFGLPRRCRRAGNPGDRSQRRRLRRASRTRRGSTSVWRRCTCSAVEPLADVAAAPTWARLSRR